eukprot:gene17143-biopygen13208
MDARVIASECANLHSASREAPQQQPRGGVGVVGILAQSRLDASTRSPTTREAPQLVDHQQVNSELSEARGASRKAESLEETGVIISMRGVIIEQTSQTPIDSDDEVTPLRDSDTCELERKLERLTYVSHAIDEITAADVRAIRKVAEGRNAAQQVTGILIHVPPYFVQTIEGPPDSIAAIFGSILADTRHYKVDVIERGGCTTRRYPGWALEVIDIGKMRGSRSAAVLELLGNADAVHIARRMAEQLAQERDQTRKALQKHREKESKRSQERNESNVSELVPLHATSSSSSIDSGDSGGIVVTALPQRFADVLMRTQLDAATMILRRCPHFIVEKDANASRCVGMKLFRVNKALVQRFKDIPFDAAQQAGGTMTLYFEPPQLGEDQQLDKLA